MLSCTLQEESPAITPDDGDMFDLFLFSICNLLLLLDNTDCSLV